MSATIRLLPGNRLHCQHGPIDLIIKADGQPREVSRAYQAAAEVFPGILPGLCAELAMLRAPIGGAIPSPRSLRLNGERGKCAAARRMASAVWPYREVFITPMAAVAGAVAEEVLAAMVAAADLERAYVNNGGDIAIHLAPGAAITAGVVADLAAPAIDATIRITAADPIRGIATSGWRGRSQSLGIADAVTVLARTAAEADAAATMIANAVDIDDPAIQRRPARQIKIDSDLGDRLVTVDVGPLSSRARDAALAAGQKYAEALVLNGRIAAACMSLQGERRVAGAFERARLSA